MRLPVLISLCWMALVHLQLQAANFIKADVTTFLGPTFFMDDAAPGGGDALVNQPATGVYIRSFAGLLTANQGNTTVSLTGMGFATSSNASSNDATDVLLAFTYLGADGVVGGGDDVFVGSTTVGFAYLGAGEYACRFDTPLTATLNITGTNFRVSVTPSNVAGNGSINFKTGTLAYESFTGARLSVSGTVSTALPATARRVNLAKYQPTSASSTNGQYIADFATDGVVGNSNSWRTTNAAGPHWAEVALPFPVTVRSAHLYLGIDDGLVPASFRIQYESDGTWLDAPGSARTGNTASEVNIVFTSSVTASRFRFYTTLVGPIRVKEFALFPPNPDPVGGAELGFPLGTDVEVNLAEKRPVVASSVNGANYAKLAVDGFVSSASKWQTTTAGAATLEIDLRVATKIGSAHLYSGDGAIAPIANFALQSWDGAAWVDIPGAVITGNTEAARVITFTTPPTTSLVRLTFNNPGTSAVRELCIFPANGGAGYPLGQDVLATAPPAWKFEDYGNAYYHIISRAADLPAAVSDASAVLAPGTLGAVFSHYQILLNVGSDTFRLRNRGTGQCLAGVGFSTTPGVALVDEDYTALPHQRWRLMPVDGTDFYLVNEHSGLVVDTQAGATAAGTALVQQTPNGATTQHWRIVQQTLYPKKGMAGRVERAEEFKGNWAYNWGRTTLVTLPKEIIFHPMQWGNFNWDIGSNAGPLEQFNSAWRREDKGMYLLGFNEPDGADQANLTVDQVLTLWPRLERMDMPLVSPVTVNPDNTWMGSFMTQAQARGLRMDAVAAHRYPDPNGGNADSVISLLQTLNTTWNLPVWLTEFSTADWTAKTSAHTSGTTETLNGIWGSSASSIWAVGDLGTILRYNGTAWSAQTSGTTATLNGIWGSSASSVWAVGSGGTVLRYNGTVWSAQTSGTSATLNGVWGSSASSVWAVGDGGVIRRFNGTTWSAQTSGTAQNLRAVWAADASNVWAVGENGTILRYNGTAWSAQTSGTSEALNGVWGSSTSSIWAVGGNGTILRFNGTAWNAQNSGTTQPLNAVWGADATNVWTVGADSTRQRTNNGITWFPGTSSPLRNLHGVWGSDAANIWHCGAIGTILNTFTGSATWTEEDNYNWLAELVWQMETLPWLRHYALFQWSASAEAPEPVNPWDTVGPRGNAFHSDGTTPTPFGELYFAWDGDTTIREDKPYFIHNKASRKRLRNATGSTSPTHRWIRDGGDSVQWILRPSGTAGQFYITSLRDGRRLRYSGGTLDFAPAHTTGPAVRWSLVVGTKGWHYLENPAAPAANRRLHFAASTFSMVANTNTSEECQWRFIVPYALADAAPPPQITGVNATVGSTQITLTWEPSPSSDFAFYTVYRSTSPGGPFILIATNLTTTSYTDTGLQNGTTYYYLVTATDFTGMESVQSTVTAAIPIIQTLPGPLGTSVSASQFTITWPATHRGWILEQANTLPGNPWVPVPGSQATTIHQIPLPPAAPRQFFRLRRP